MKHFNRHLDDFRYSKFAAGIIQGSAIHMAHKRNNIRDTEPTTSFLKRNTYHMHMPLFVLDVIRVFQDHPNYCNGLKEHHIVNFVKTESFACGDVESQVKMALKELSSSGFIRYINHGYRTLGPFAKLGTARSTRQLNSTWDRISCFQSLRGKNH